MKIWLDDTRTAPDGWIWYKNPRAVYSILITNGEAITHLSLDHDLAWFESGKEITGYTLLCWIEKMVFNGEINYVPELTIHSANSVGRSNMERAIRSINRLMQSEEK